MEKQIKESLVQEFIDLMVKLKAMDIVVLAKLLGVPVTNENNEKLEAETILENLIVAYGQQNRRNRRDILTILKQTIKRY